MSDSLESPVGIFASLPRRVRRFQIRPTRLLICAPTRSLMDRDVTVTLSEYIWAFVHGFWFRSRSDKWCAIEPRGEGLGGGVRCQGGAQVEEGRAVP